MCSHLIISFGILLQDLLQVLAAEVSDQNPWLEASFRGVKHTQSSDLSPSGNGFENKTVEYNCTNLLRIYGAPDVSFWF